MRSEDFSFGFAENVSEFVIFGENIRKIQSFYKFYRVDLNVQRVKREFEIARAWKFWYMKECCSTNNSDVKSLGVRYGDLRVWKLQNPMIAERCQEMMEIPIICWLWHEKEQNCPTKIDGSLSTYLSSQSVDCVRQASCIQEPKSRKNQAEWHRSLDSCNH